MAQKINLSQLNPQQLYQLRQGFQNQINLLNQSMQQFRFASDKYEEGKRAIKAAEDCTPNQQILLPLSNSLYIEGKINNFQNGIYLIEYGAGFFVELNAQLATQFYTRKIGLIKEKSTKLQDILNDKREGYKHVEMRLMALVQQKQQEQSQVQTS